MLKRLRELLGDDLLREGSEAQAWTIDGVKPAAVLFPESTAEVVEIVRMAARSDWTIVPANRPGGAAKGNPPRRCDLVVSLTRMNAILEYEPADLTAAVQAGCQLAAFNDTARRHGQWLPLDPPGAESATLGSVAATDDFGPLRTGFGLMHDYVIGMEAVLADGSIVHSGGRVVKNVAGFDMNKLYVGSHGTLGIITRLNLKLRPEPESEATLLIEAKAPATLFELSDQVIHSELLPSALEICDPGGWSALLGGGAVLSGAPTASHGLAIRFMEAQSAVEYQRDRIVELARAREVKIDRIDAEGSRAFWSGWNRVFNPGPASASLRLSCLPEHTAPLLEWGEKRLSPWTGRFGITATPAWGIVRAIAETTFDEAALTALAAFISDWRSEANAVGGHLTVESAPVGLKRIVDTWGDVGPQCELMRRIKAKFDPHSRFSPGRFVDGL